VKLYCVYSAKWEDLENQIYVLALDLGAELLANLAE